MRRFNFARPILIIAVALLVKTLTVTICIALGATEESADSISFITMIIAALLVFTRLKRSGRNQ